MNIVEQDLQTGLTDIAQDIRAGARDFAQDIRTGVRDIEGGIAKVEKEGKNIIDAILTWALWEKILHIAVAVVFVVVLYFFLVKPQQRTLTNYLLLLIAMGIALQVHQNINIKDLIKV